MRILRDLSAKMQTWGYFFSLFSVQKKRKHTCFVCISFRVRLCALYKLLQHPSSVAKCDIVKKNRLREKRMPSHIIPSEISFVVLLNTLSKYLIIFFLLLFHLSKFPLVPFGGGDKTTVWWQKFVLNAHVHSNVYRRPSLPVFGVTIPQQRFRFINWKNRIGRMN